MDPSRQNLSVKSGIRKSTPKKESRFNYVESNDYIFQTDEMIFESPPEKTFVHIGKCPVTHLRRAYKEQAMKRHHTRPHDVSHPTTYGFSITKR